MIDLIANKAVIFTDDLGTDRRITPKFPQILVQESADAREQMISLIAETDDSLGEKYLGGEEITEPELRAALRRALLATNSSLSFAAAH